MKNQIIEILKTYPTSYNRIISKNSELMAYINSEVSADIKISEKIFLILNDLTELPICSCGNRLNFLSVSVGYSKGCSTKCPDTILRAKEKRSKTLKNKYGTDNLNLIDDFNIKRKIGYITKYGVDNPFKSDIIKEKIIKTNNLKYGVDNPAQSKIIKEKISKTMVEKYGVENYFKSHIGQERIKNIKLEKYGTTFPIQNLEIKEKRFTTNISKYGGGAPNCSKEIKEKIKLTAIKKYGVDHHTKNHISFENLEILNDRNYLLELINKDQNIIKTSNTLGVNITTIYNYIKKHNISLNVDIKFNFKSSQEQELSSFLDSIGVNYVKNTKQIISPYELDFFIPDNNLAIEMNGLYWHSDNFKKEDYHYTKYMQCKEKGIQLIQIWDNEWRNHKDIVMNMLTHKLGKNKLRVYGRNTIVQEIQNKIALKFLDINHIQGRTPKITVSIGLYEQSNLIAVMTFQKIQNGYDLTRYSTDKSIPGGFSKLLKYFTQAYGPQTIISFSDNRWSWGDVYYKNGFERQKDIPFAYYYTDYKSFYHRFNFRKKLIEKRYDIDISNKTEKELVKELGFARIWDAGKIKWVLNKK